MVSKFYGCSTIAEAFCCLGLLYTIANSLFPERNYFYHYIISVMLCSVFICLMVSKSNESPVVFVFIAFFAGTLCIHSMWMYIGIVYMSYNVTSENRRDDKAKRDATMLLAYGTFGVLYTVGKSDFHCSVCPVLHQSLSLISLLYSYLLFSPLSLSFLSNSNDVSRPRDYLPT